MDTSETYIKTWLSRYDHYHIDYPEEREAEKFLRGIKSIKFNAGGHSSWVELSYTKKVSKLALAVVANILNLIQWDNQAIFKATERSINKRSRIRAK